MAVVFYLSSFAAYAATLDFSFSFVDTANCGHTVAGIVRGMTDNATGAPARVEVLTNTAGFGIGGYMGDPITTSFTFVAGVITDAIFESFGARNTAPAVTDSTSFLIAIGSNLASGLSNLPNSISVAGASVLNFTPVAAAPVPLPAAGVLLMAGLGGLGFVTRTKSA
ncbi:MAG: VPLPA-CTERM sorting domain-containing protein [Pseudomonadota bacterium]